MSRNPFQHPVEEAAALQSPRVSGLSIASLVFGLLCCIPGSGFIGAILGGAGLVSISKSDGRLSGRGMAFSGLILGLLGTMLWFGIVIGGYIGLKELNQFVQPVYTIAKGDFSQARPHLSKSTAAKLTDEKAKEFTDALTAELGPVTGLPKGVMGWLNGYADQSDMLEAAKRTPGDKGIPIPVHFDKDTALMVVYLETGTFKGMPPITNVAVYTRSGKVIWLVPEKDAGP